MVTNISHDDLSNIRAALSAYRSHADTQFPTLPRATDEEEEVFQIDIDALRPWLIAKDWCDGMLSGFPPPSIKRRNDPLPYFENVWCGSNGDGWYYLKSMPTARAKALLSIVAWHRENRSAIDAIAQAGGLDA